MARIEVNTKEETTESLKALSSYFASLCGAVELEDTPAPEDTPGFRRFPGPPRPRQPVR